MRKTVLVIVWSVLPIGGLQAQSAEKVWTLEECMRYAIENSHEVKKQQYTNANYRQDYISAVAQMMPSVSGSVDVSSNFGRSLDPATNTYASNVNFNNSYGVGASIGVFGGFTAINNLRLTKVARRQGEDELQKAADDISLSVMENYFWVVYYEGVVRMSAEQLEESRLKLRQTVEQEALGLKSRADVVQVEAEVATNDAALTGSRNNLTNYLTLLKTKMNYPLNDTLRIDTQVDLLAQEMSETAESIYFDARRQNPMAKIADFNLRQRDIRSPKAITILPYPYRAATRPTISSRTWIIPISRPRSKISSAITGGNISRPRSAFRFSTRFRAARTSTAHATTC